MAFYQKTNFCFIKFRSSYDDRYFNDNFQALPKGKTLEFQLKLSHIYYYICHSKSQNRLINKNTLVIIREDNNIGSKTIIKSLFPFNIIQLPKLEIMSLCFIATLDLNICLFEDL